MLRHGRIITKKMARKIDKSGIYVDAQNLLRTIYKAQFEIPKRDRPVLVTRMLDHTEAIISNFALAYREDRLVDKRRYVDAMSAHFEALKVEIRMVVDGEAKMLKVPGLVNEIKELTVKLHEGIEKWRNSMVISE